MDEKKSVKLFGSVFLMFGYVFLLMFAFGIWALVFIVFLQGGNNATTEEEIKVIFICISAFLAITLIIVICLSHRAFGMIEISEKGIKRSLFAIFKKRELLWQDIIEIRAFWQVGTWLFVSKTSLEDLNYNQLIKHRDAIQISLSTKALQAIREYYDEPIIGLSAEDEARIMEHK